MKGEPKPMHLPLFSILLFLSLLITPSTSYDFLTFDNTTSLPCSSSAPCSLSDPNIWQQRISPTPRHSLSISTNSELFFLVAGNLTVEYVNIRTGGGLIIEDGSLTLTAGSMADDGVSMDIHANVSMKNGELHANGTITFYGARWDVEGASRVEAYTLTDDYDGINFKGVRAAMTIKDTSQVTANIEYASTTLSMQNQASLYIPLTMDMLAVLAGLRVEDDARFEVAQTILLLNGITTFESSQNLWVNGLSINGTASFDADLTINLAFTLFVGSRVTLTKNFDGMQGIKVIDGFYSEGSNGNATIIVNDADMRICSGSAASGGLNVIQGVLFTITNCNLFIGNEAYPDYIVDTSFSRIVAIKSTVSGFFSTSSGLVLDGESMFLPYRVSMSGTINTMARMVIPWYGQLNVERNAHVTFDVCEWWPWSFLNVYGNFTCNLGSTADQSLSLTLDGGVMTPGYDIDRLVVENLSINLHSALLCRGVHVTKNLKILSAEETVLEIPGDLTIGQNMTIPAFSKFSSPLIRADGPININGARLILDASKVNVKPGEVQTYTLMTSNVNIEGNFVQVHYTDLHDLKASISYESNIIRLSFSQDEKRDFPRFGYVVIAAVVLLIAAIGYGVWRNLRRSKRKGYYALHEGKLIGGPL